MGKKEKEKKERKEPRKPRGGSGYKAEDFQDLMAQLKPMNLSVLKMDADGNCLFRAVADQLWGDANEHNEVRDRCCEHMLQHPEDFEAFCVADDFESPCDYRSYVQKMRHPGTWGSQLELMAICQTFSVNAILHQSGLPSYEMVFSPEENQCIQLSYHDGEHYNSVRFAWDLEGPAKAMSLAQLKGNGEKLERLLEQVKHSLPEHGFDDDTLRKALVEAKEDVDLAVERLLCKMAEVPEEPEQAEPQKVPGHPEEAPADAKSRSRVEKRQERKAKVEAKQRKGKAQALQSAEGKELTEQAMQQLCKQLLTV